MGRLKLGALILLGCDSCRSLRRGRRRRGRRRWWRANPYGINSVVASQVRSAPSHSPRRAPLLL
jgi:hypothetical protein